MRLSVIGCGYLGAVHAAAMASIGHDVVGIDQDVEKVRLLAQGISPFFEPQLTELLKAGIASGRLTFSNKMSAAEGADVHFVAVGTPQAADGNAADLTYIHSAFAALAPFLHRGNIVAGKSTVPVGTAEKLSGLVVEQGATLVWNPEFLREGWAVQDTISPDRIVIGVPDGLAGQTAADTLQKVYHPAASKQTPFVVTDYATAELVKSAANSFLATKISFINAMAEIAEVTGADVVKLAEAIGYDDRIGRKFLGAGLGFGGGCLPKDIRAFAARAEELNLHESVAFLHEVDSINLRCRDRVIRLVQESLGGTLVRKRVAVLGAAFKPHSDDIRDSPALDIAARLHGMGADVVVTDPKAVPNAKRAHPELQFTTDRDSAMRNADAIVIATEWDEYRRDLSPVHAEALTAGRVVIDGRNCLSPEEWKLAGWQYFGMGRS